MAQSLRGPKLQELRASELQGQVCKFQFRFWFRCWFWFWFQIQFRCWFRCWFRLLVWFSEQRVRSEDTTQAACKGHRPATSVVKQACTANCSLCPHGPLKNAGINPTANSAKVASPGAQLHTAAAHFRNRNQKPKPAATPKSELEPKPKAEASSETKTEAETETKIRNQQQN